MSNKKNTLRSDFTDALDEEISSRKILERANLKETPKAVKVETAAPAVDTAENIAAASVEVEAEPKLEERIMKEADNTFFDEKPARKSVTTAKTVDKPPPRSIYHSKALRRWEQEHQGESSPPPPAEPVAQEPPSRMSRAEKAGFVIAITMMVYAFVALDKPMFFLSMSLLVHTLRPLIGAMAGKYSQPVQNAMRSFSIVLFFGAILFIFI